MFMSSVPWIFKQVATNSFRKGFPFKNIKDTSNFHYCQFTQFNLLVFEAKKKKKMKCIYFYKDISYGDNI